MPSRRKSIFHRDTLGLDHKSRQFGDFRQQKEVRRGKELSSARESALRMQRRWPGFHQKMFLRIPGDCIATFYNYLEIIECVVGGSHGSRTDAAIEFNGHDG